MQHAGNPWLSQLRTRPNQYLLRVAGHSSRPRHRCLCRAAAAAAADGGGGAAAPPPAAAAARAGELPADTVVCYSRALHETVWNLSGLTCGLCPSSRQSREGIREAPTAAAITQWHSQCVKRPLQVSQSCKHTQAPSVTAGACTVLHLDGAILLWLQDRHAAAAAAARNACCSSYPTEAAAATCLCCSSFVPHPITPLHKVDAQIKQVRSTFCALYRVPVNSLLHAL